MSISKKIRLATVNDSSSLLTIYKQFIIDTAVTFEIEVPSDLEFGKRIATVLEKLPWLICEINGENVGYAYASKHRDRAAYQWSVDVTVYIDPEYHRMNIATALYTALVELLRTQGYYNAYAGIALPNIKSEGFHESFGFNPVGIYHNVGYKLGQWRDVKWFELTLSEHSKSPAAPKTIKKISGTEKFDNIIENAVQLIKYKEL